ncbi:unnamed protein product [Cuscuta europaea]|uniref:Uncharacterized protein n=1 Tax=Cuscuta europaea TaxID=41803 RepID=A0A9P1A150_CUSEU|nr:unnamed protein product [Cuscuta europaea]
MRTQRRKIVIEGLFKAICAFPSFFLTG